MHGIFIRIYIYTTDEKINNMMKNKSKDQLIRMFTLNINFNKQIMHFQRDSLRYSVDSPTDLTAAEPTKSNNNCRPEQSNRNKI